MVVKFPANQITGPATHFGTLNEYQLSTFECSHMRNWGFEKEGKLTLSIKVGKKRKLVAGRLRIEVEYSRYGPDYIYLNFYFTPNSPEKLYQLLKVA